MGCSLVPIYKTEVLKKVVMKKIRGGRRRRRSVVTY